MLTLLDELSENDAMPDGTLDSVRPKQQQAQLELFELDSDITTVPTYADEDPIVRRIIRDVGGSSWIRRIAEDIEEIVPYWSWQKYISNLVDSLTWGVPKQVSDILKKAACKVAVKTAQGQPPFHKYSSYRPNSCQVFRFGPKARGPPEEDRLPSSSCAFAHRVVPFHLLRVLPLAERRHGGTVPLTPLFEY